MASTSTRRLGYYVQTHHYENHPHKWLSMEQLGESRLHTSHIVVSSFHLNYTKDNGAGNRKIYLNDQIYDQDDNIKVWQEAKKLQSKGILVFGLLGGGGIWETTGLGGEGDVFEKGYGLIRDMISATGLDGVDLNVEPHNPAGVQDIGNEGVLKVIRRLKTDFPRLLITMCPGGAELLDEGGLSAVKYLELWKLPEIRENISWFNCQLYNGWGKLNVDEFTRYVDGGYPAEKLVMLLVGNPDPQESAEGWIDGKEIKKNLDEILKKFPNMGGVACWDWFNASLDGKKPVTHPEKWSQFVSEILHAKSTS